MYKGVLHVNLLFCSSSVPIEPIRVAQKVARLTHESRSTPADPRSTVVSYWRKYVLVVAVSCLRDLRLPRSSVVMITDSLEMTMTAHLGH